MSETIYFMPIIGDGTKLDPRRPKYRSDLDGLNWSMMDFGLEPVCIISVTDVPALTHASLVANLDVRSAPSNLDQQIGAATATVKTFLESTLGIPSNWIQSSDTYRKDIRIICAMFQFLQRLSSNLSTRLLSGGVDLDTRFNQLSANTRQQLINAADSFNFDTSSLSGTSTIRQILKAMADQWGAREMLLNGQVI